MDIQRNNAFSSVAMEVAYNEGEEWLTQLLAYVSENFDFIKKYFDENIPKSSLMFQMLHIWSGWTARIRHEQ